jgi:hypothetical protein
MSNSLRPNDQMAMSGLGVPINPWSRMPLPPLLLARLSRLKEAELAFRLVLHELDGTTEGSRPGNRRMALAFTRLEETKLWAAAAILEPED